jgi:hypothetical protein
MLEMLKNIYHMMGLIIYEKFYKSLHSNNSTCINKNSFTHYL